MARRAPSKDTKQALFCKWCREIIASAPHGKPFPKGWQKHQCLVDMQKRGGSASSLVTLMHIPKDGPMRRTPEAYQQYTDMAAGRKVRTEPSTPSLIPTSTLKPKAKPKAILDDPKPAKRKAAKTAPMAILDEPPKRKAKAKPLGKMKRKPAGKPVSRKVSTPPKRKADTKAHTGMKRLKQRDLDDILGI